MKHDQPDMEKKKDPWDQRFLRMSDRTRQKTQVHMITRLNRGAKLGPTNYAATYMYKVAQITWVSTAKNPRFSEVQCIQQNPLPPLWVILSLPFDLVSIRGRLISTRLKTLKNGITMAFGSCIAPSSSTRGISFMSQRLHLPVTITLQSHSLPSCLDHCPCTRCHTMKWFHSRMWQTTYISVTKTLIILNPPKNTIPQIIYNHRLKFRNNKWSMDS